MTDAIKIHELDKGAICIVEFNQPPANALTTDMIEGLSKLLKVCETDHKTRVVLLTGAGQRFFIGGVQLNEIASIRSPEHGYALAKAGQDLCTQVALLTIPVIAAINGECLGGGHELAIACHIRIASERAIFQQPEVHLGLMPAFGGTQRLPRLIGPGNARKMILACERVTAQEALRLGLVDELVKPENVIRRSVEIAGAIARKSPAAVRLAQRAMQVTETHSLHAGLEVELACFKELCGVGEMQEALTAFRERRKPVFQKSR